MVRTNNFKLLECDYGQITILLSLVYYYHYYYLVCKRRIIRDYVIYFRALKFTTLSLGSSKECEQDEYA